MPSARSASQPALHRIDLPASQTGFTPPPFNVRLKVLPSPREWTLVGHAEPGKPHALARWLVQHPGFDHVRVGPGLAPRLLRATIRSMPPAWAALASIVRVHQLDLGADGQATWFIEGTRDQVWTALQQVAEEAPTARCRPVLGDAEVPAISRRQFETLSTAVALGYYEIPHRIDLRRLAAKTGVSLGSVSELLRRAEGTILAHYVDVNLMKWPTVPEDEAPETMPMVGTLRR